jgi:dipeptidyl aminopeptidase/acylaminoacyl peptidase
LRLWDITDQSLILSNEAQTSRITSLAVSQDNSLVASGSMDGSVVITSISDSIFDSIFNIPVEEISWLEFSPDLDLLAAGSSEGTLALWNLSENTLERQTTAPNGEIVKISFSYIPGRLVTYSGPDVNLMTRQEWDLPGLTSLSSDALVMPEFSNPYHGLALSGDDSILSAGTGIGTVEIWNFQNAVLERILTGHSSGIFDLAFSPDGKLLASASDDRTTRLWDTISYQTRYILRGHKDLVTSLAFSPDSQYIANGSREAKVWIWQTLNGNLGITLKLRCSNAHSPLPAWFIHWMDRGWQPD